MVSASSFKLRSMNRLDFLNEVIIYYTSFSMMLFSDFNPDVQNKELCGWLMIGFTFLNMGFNVLLLLRPPIHKLWLRAQRVITIYLDKRRVRQQELSQNTKQQSSHPEKVTDETRESGSDDEKVNVMNLTFGRKLSLIVENSDEESYSERLSPEVAEK